MADDPSPEWERTVEVARSLTVEDVVRRLNLGDSVKRGRELAVHCPLHADDNPSLTFDPGGSVWYCFPCATGGDALDLYMRVRQIDFVAAVKELVPSVRRTSS